MSAFTDFLENALIDGLFRSKTASAWSASTAYSVGDIVFPTSANGFVYEATSGGTSGASEPAWPTTLGGTVTDNTVTWKALKVPGRALKRPLYVALFTADPTDTGSTTNEVSGGGYSRVQLDPADANWNPTSGTDGHTDNASKITFPTATASWGTVTHFAIMDAATGGNMLFHGALTASKTVNASDTIEFAVGALDITLA